MIRPRSIVGQTALVLVGGVVVALLLALLLFVGQRRQALDSLAGRNISERLAVLAELCEDMPPSERRHAVGRLDSPLLRTGWSVQPLVQTDEQSDGFAARLAQSVRQTVDPRPVRISLHLPHLPHDGHAGSMVGMGGGSGMGGGGMGGGSGGRGRGLGAFGFVPGPQIALSIQLQDGSWLNALTPLDHGQPLWNSAFLLPLLGLVGVVVAVALWMVIRATRPFARFAAAATRLGLDVGAAPMEESGPSEVRRAALAFNQMQHRIRRFVEDRTLMLAAISHDLRTPITRLKLRAEFVEDEQERLHMLADLDEMERMIRATLDFARDDATREPRQKLDVALLVQDLAESFDLSYQGPEHARLEVRPLALKRAISNVLHNAATYGPPARVEVQDLPHALTVAVSDHGPGIPDEQRERVFTPFVRLEHSRNRETGGTGLGLSIARAAIRAHGGDITLHTGQEGGLQVILTLPKG